MIQEWWGLNDQIRDVAEEYSAQGYRALVPDLYRGKMALEANEAEHLMNDLDFADAANQDIRGAVQHLKSTGSSKAGVTGYCMGGALMVLTAVFVPESDANAIWYGYPPLEYVDADKIQAPLLGHWGTQDEFFCYRRRGCAGRKTQKVGYRVRILSLRCQTCFRQQRC